VITLAIDPGLLKPAWALFKDDVLVRAQRTKVPGAYSKLPVGERCRQVAILIYNDVTALEPAIDELVIEWPQVYRATKSKGDPNDLLPLSGVGMALAGRFGVPVTSPTPREWIGTLPKATSGDPLASPRGARIWSRLSDAERACVVLSHDALDAIGIGLWHRKRLGGARVLPGINCP
jgi:hypothetical protein